ncbi:MAG: rubredoxin [Coriobacteriales bacterium]
MCWRTASSSRTRQRSTGATPGTSWSRLPRAWRCPR